MNNDNRWVTTIFQYFFLVYFNAALNNSSMKAFLPHMSEFRRQLITFLRQNIKHILDKMKNQTVVCFHTKHIPDLSKLSSDLRQTEGKPLL